MVTSDEKMTREQFGRSGHLFEVAWTLFELKKIGKDTEDVRKNLLAYCNDQVALDYCAYQYRGNFDEHAKLNGGTMTIDAYLAHCQ